jgi:hypothetical protein
MSTERKPTESNTDSFKTESITSAAAKVVGGAYDRQPVRGPLPRPARHPRKSKADRGLPPDEEELATLATAYLERQRKLWPKLVDAGLLPEPSPAVVRHMVEDFKHRHRAGDVDVAGVLPFAKFCRKLAGSYSRYSCDNSSPTSVLDQMVNCLKKAHEEERFIPWQHVFADFSLSGLDSSRQGYVSYKQLLADPNQLIETTYIDDFTRASRDDIEWWRLAELSKKLRKRMIGASDGFNLDDPNWEIWLTIFGLLSRLFIKSLREKVHRGMLGAARRGRCTGKLSLGFTRRVIVDDDGHALLGPDERPVHEPCIDPATQEHRLLLYKLFVEQQLSAYKIAKHFNQLKVDDWDGWCESTIKDLLRNPTSIGVFIYNKCRKERDRETGTVTDVPNPRSEWEVSYEPNLAIVPLDLWRGACRKLAAMRRASPLTGRKPSRNQKSATTLFSGTLVCEYCGAELILIRSTSSHKQFGCANGMKSARGCKLSTSKSLRMVEESLLGFIHEVVLTESRVEGLVVDANAAIEEEAKKPRVDTAPWKNQLRRHEAKINKLVRRVEDEPNEEFCSEYEKRINELKRECNGLKAQIAKAESRQHRPPRPLSLKQTQKYLADFRTSLNQGIAAAAEAIRTLTGAIKIRQERVPGRNLGARWIASFSPDLFRALGQVDADVRSAQLACRDKLTTTANEVVIDKIHKYEKLAPVFKELREKGASIQTIATAHGMSWQYAKEILKFADTGERPKWKSRKKCRKGGRQQIKFTEIAAEVAKLRDKQNRPFSEIATRLNASENTVRRAYDHARPDQRLAALDGHNARSRRVVQADCFKRLADQRRAIGDSNTMLTVREIVFPNPVGKARTLGPDCLGIIRRRRQPATRKQHVDIAFFGSQPVCRLSEFPARSTLPRTSPTPAHRRLPTGRSAFA